MEDDANLYKKFFRPNKGYHSVIKNIHKHGFQKVFVIIMGSDPALLYFTHLNHLL